MPSARIIEPPHAGAGGVLAAQSPASVLPSGNWSLLFSDEFQGAGVPAPSVWRWYYGSALDSSIDGTNMAENAGYYPEDLGQVGGITQSLLTLSGGKMRVGAIATPGGTGRFAAQNWDYMRGLARTAQTFQPTSGHGLYFEARLTLPAGQGFWPALWLWPPNADALDPNWYEIDFLECPSTAASGYYTNVHWGTFSSPSQSGPELQSGSVVGPVVIGGIWRTNEVRFYKNGVENGTAFTDAAHVPNVPMSLHVDFQVGGTWPGNPDGSTVFPAEVTCDYVRVWREI